eukprot:TRINITY_DN1723_c0_g1_i1.p1 TRINITY_DN1723_c0_g1~~TRINITY_DN1723_c0_g1_i1.p1  ORF type:complete len:340 (-),score=58.03 TRINITY_DN1723_c0_g1_i1:326-1345(-)
MCALLHLILCSCWTTCAALSSALHAGRSATPRPEVLEVDSAGGIKLHATTAAAVALSPGPAASQEERLRHENAELRRAFGYLLKENEDLRKEDASIRRLLLTQSVDENYISEVALVSSFPPVLDTKESFFWLDGRNHIKLFEEKFGLKIDKLAFACIFFILLLVSLIGTVVCLTGPGHDEHGKPVHGTEGFILKLVHTFPLLALLVFAMFEFGVLWELGLLGQMYDKLIEYAALVIFAAAAICTIVVQLSRIIYNVARRLADVAVRLEEQFMAYWRRLHSRLEGGLQSAKARMSNSCGPAFLWSRRHSLATAAPSGDPALSTMTPQSSADATPTGAAST